jgi:hypothetical protein
MKLKLDEAALSVLISALGNTMSATLPCHPDPAVPNPHSIGTRQKSSCVLHTEQHQIFLHGHTMSDMTRIQIADPYLRHQRPPHVRGVCHPLLFGMVPSLPFPFPFPPLHASTMVYSSGVPSDDVTLLPLANSELAMGSAFFDPCFV